MSLYRTIETIETVAELRERCKEHQATIEKLTDKLVDMTAKAHQWCGEFQKAHAINGGKQATIEKLERLRSAWKEETDRLNQELAEGVKVVSAFLRSYGGDSCHMDMERWVVANRQHWHSAPVVAAEQKE